MGVSTGRLTPRLSASSTSSTPSITHQHCPQRGATVRRVPKTPVHCPFLPWEYYYNGALAPPSPPALPLLCPPPRASCALHCGSGRRAAAARVRPPRPSSWGSMTKVQKSGNSRAKPIPVECLITEVSSLRTGYWPPLLPPSCVWCRPAEIPQRLISGRKAGAVRGGQRTVARNFRTTSFWSPGVKLPQRKT